ncbi:MAG: T9SS type A sorting domain-containing protein, partial [Spirosomataceae bacterium]
VQWVTGVGSTTLLTFPTTPIALGNAGTFYARCQTTTAGCWSTNTATVSITFRPTPQSALTASKVDVCPNELVTLDAHCTIPTATVNWNPGAPTVTPNAAPTPYIYKASCTADGCTGNESSVEVRTHRILVDMKDLGSGPLPKAVIGSVQDNMAPTNTITAPSMPRRWTFIATGCAASESAVFKLSGPVNFNTIDNAATYAMFANEGSNFYSIDHPNYGNGGSFPNGTYTLTIDLRSQDGVGGPFPKNRMPTGALLATRTLQFTVANSLNRIGTAEEPIAAALKDENWMNIGQNPVSDKIQVHLFGKANEEVHLSLMNLQGQTVRLKSIKMEASQQIEVLDVTDAPSGLYILKGAKADQVKTIKVIKID